MICSITLPRVALIFNITTGANDATLRILAIHCIDKSRNVALMPSGVAIYVQARILPQHIVPHHNISRGIEIPEHMQADSEMAITAGKHIHLSHYLIFKGCTVFEPISESHIVTITIGPMMAIGRTGGTFLQRDRIERHPAPRSLGDYVMSLAELAIIGNGLDDDMVRWILHRLGVDGAGLSESGIGRLQAHGAIVSQSAKGCKCESRIRYTVGPKRPGPAGAKSLFCKGLRFPLHSLVGHMRPETVAVLILSDMPADITEGFHDIIERGDICARSIVCTHISPCDCEACFM